jgi:hypothetical protein
MPSATYSTTNPLNYRLQQFDFFIKKMLQPHNAALVISNQQVRAVSWSVLVANVLGFDWFSEMSLVQFVSEGGLADIWEAPIVSYRSVPAGV